MEWSGRWECVALEEWVQEGCVAGVYVCSDWLSVLLLLDAG